MILKERRSRYSRIFISEFGTDRSNCWSLLISYNAFAGSGFCPVPGHVILTCKLYISGKI